jgi:CBS domain-containing protein
MRITDYATRNVVTVAPHDSIDKAMSLMEERNLHHLVVVLEKSRVVGMLSDRDVLISTGWMLAIERCTRDEAMRPRVAGPTHVRQIMSQPVECITATYTVRDAAMIMLQRKISALPMLSEGRLTGLVTETDLVKWPPLCELHVDHFLNGDVAGLMRANVLSVVPEAPLSEVIHLFRSRRIRHVPVTKDGQLVGIISDRDVRRALGWGNVRDLIAESEGRSEMNTPQTAADIMHTRVRTVGMGTPLRDALRVMLDERIHSLPVVEGHALNGIVTQTDFLRAFARETI